MDVFWSHTACDDGDDWANVRRKTLEGATVLATTPQAYFPPYHYKVSAYFDAYSNIHSTGGQSPSLL